MAFLYSLIISRLQCKVKIKSEEFGGNLFCGMLVILKHRH